MSIYIVVKQMAIKQILIVYSMHAMSNCPWNTCRVVHPQGGVLIQQVVHTYANNTLQHTGTLFLQTNIWSWYPTDHDLSILPPWSKLWTRWHICLFTFHLGYLLHQRYLYKLYVHLHQKFDKKMPSGCQCTL